MGKWSSYSLSDFILFTESAYYRQFELYNEAVWPLHIIAVIFVLAITYVLWRRPAWGGRLTAFILVTSWLWVAWAYLYERFSQLHVVADWYALAFVLQAVLLSWYGLIKNRFDSTACCRTRQITSAILLLVAMLVYPLLAVLNSRPWMQFEMFGLAPDPTVLATLAIVLFHRGPMLLYVVPLAWLLVSTLTLIGMQ